MEVQNLGEISQSAAQTQGASPQGGGNAAPAGGSQETPTRPEWLGESYWDAEKGTIKFDEFGKHYGEVFATYKAHTDRLASYPQKIEDLKIELPEGLNLPEGYALDDSNPAYAEARKLVFENKIDPAVASQMIGLHVKERLAEVQKINERIAEENAKLGANAAARVGAVTDALKGVVGEEHASALMSGIYTAAQVEALEKIVLKLANGNTAGVTGGQREADNGEISDEEYEKMTPAQKLAYARQHQQRKVA